MPLAQVSPRVEAMPEHSATAIAGIGQHHTEVDALGSQVSSQAGLAMK